MRKGTTLAVAIAMAVGGFAAGPVAADTIKVGNIVDFTGRTAVVGKVYGQAKVDAMNWINENGGVNGKMLEVDTVDYSYQVPRAIQAYKKWQSEGDVVAIQGWGTGDTEALVTFVAKDQIPYYSASYSGHLTDPQGKNPNTTKPAPYNFFYGPSYSDGVRGLIQWAAEDWKAKGGSGAPKYVHMGDNHPYPNAPKKSGEEYAAELGFEVLPAIQYSLAPSDFKAQCLALKESGANYAFLANTSGSNISLLKSCDTVGVDVQFMANVWGYDENVMAAAGTAADGVAWVMGSAAWGADVPGMKKIEEISKLGDPSVDYRAVHYMRGVCSVFYMAEAMAIADGMDGGITGENIKKAMYERQGWVPEGLDGVCLASSWSPDDHRGTNKVYVYRGLTAGGASDMEEVYVAEIPRKDEWLGQ